MTIFEFLLPVCVQGILLIRLVAVYRPSEMPWGQGLAIYAPIVAFKIARLVNAGLATQHLLSHTPPNADVIVAAQIVWGTKYIKVEWFLQLFDDMYVTLSSIARFCMTLISCPGWSLDSSSINSTSTSEPANKLTSTLGTQIPAVGLSYFHIHMLTSHAYSCIR